MRLRKPREKEGRLEDLEIVLRTRCPVSESPNLSLSLNPGAGDTPTEQDYSVASRCSTTPVSAFFSNQSAQARQFSRKSRCV